MRHVREWVAAWPNPGAAACGDVAACVEDASAEVLRVRGGWAPSDMTHWGAPQLLLRVHAEVDADNGCFDHVCFLLPAWPQPTVLDAYVDVCGPRLWAVQPTARRWLKAVAQLPSLQGTAEGLTAAWRTLFNVPAAPGFRGPVGNVAVHVSHWRFVGPLPAVHRSGGASAGPSPSCRPLSAADLASK